MINLVLCIVIVILLLWYFVPGLLCGDDTGLEWLDNYGYATNSPASADGYQYNDYLQTVALDPSIKEQHQEWLNNLQINTQPRMYSIRDDCDDGETPRWGLLKKDYGIVINENQNIPIPSGRTCTAGDGGNSRWGGYGIGTMPVNRSI
jgi:hypothetical protein